MTNNSNDERSANDVDNPTMGVVLDAEVIRNEQHHDAQQKIIMGDGGSSRREVVHPSQQQQQQQRRRRRFFPPSNQRSEGYYYDNNMDRKQHEQHQDRSWRSSSGAEVRANMERDWEDNHGKDRNQSRHRRHHQQHHHRPQSTTQKQNVREGGERRNYNLYASKDNYYDGMTDNDVIDRDDDFRLGIEQGDEDARNLVYDNGLQIFLMGFYEAGKTATRLVTDAVVDAVLDGTNSATASFVSGRDGWRYDNDDDMGEGRQGQRWQSVDANILGYSPRAKGERSPRRRRRSTTDEYYNNNGVRSQGQWSGTEKASRQDEYPPIHRVERRRMPPRSRSSLYEDPIEESPTIEEEGMSQYMLPSEISITGSNDTDIERDNGEGDDEAISDSKRIYGLYASQREREEKEVERELHHKRQWKDRLRRKFDDALGLHPPVPSSVSSQESYYHSRKDQVEGVDDGRKEVLRRRLNEDVSYADHTPSPYLNNRRARMRAKSTVVSSPPSSRRQLDNKSFQRSRLEEVPFWREGGTIASLLFDNQQSPSSRPTRRSRTLEVCDLWRWIGIT